MFDLNRLYKILNETTVQLRKGNVFEGTPELVKQMEDGIPEGEMLQGGGVLEVSAMPHQSEAGDLEKVDLHFLVIGVDKAKAETRRQEFIAILDSWPTDELAGGPSYITVGGTIGDQGAVFQMFALGKALGLWSVITPALLGATGLEADQMAGGGFIMMSGYQRKAGNP